MRATHSGRGAPGGGACSGASASASGARCRLARGTHGAKPSSSSSSSSASARPRAWLRPRLRDPPLGPGLAESKTRNLLSERTRPSAPGLGLALALGPGPVPALALRLVLRLARPSACPRARLSPRSPGQGLVSGIPCSAKGLSSRSASGSSSRLASESSSGSGAAVFCYEPSEGTCEIQAIWFWKSCHNFESNELPESGFIIASAMAMCEALVRCF